MVPSSRPGVSIATLSPVSRDRMKRRANFVHTNSSHLNSVAFNEAGVCVTVEMPGRHPPMWLVRRILLDGREALPRSSKMTNRV